MSARRVAGGAAARRRAAEAEPDPFEQAAVVVGVVPSGEGVRLLIDNREGFPPDELAALLRGTADGLDGKDDRTRGLF